MKPWSERPPRAARRPTRTVRIGDVPIGSEHPIAVQSMTTPATRDVAATVGQIERLVDAGCEIVRVTVPTRGDAEALPGIRRELARRRVRVPLVADIHFTPSAAMQAVEHVEKIRINPGNYADKKKFAVREYTDAEYDAELERIEAAFVPLVRRCRELGVSMRIGTNHGSLSDRIMNRYGDTPEGMVESALEFVRICERHDYRELVLSMKASNPVVVLEVYRLLAARMATEGMAYPFHLGVTEAGDGEDGRNKSAVGIGALLDEGLGDTVRVSLTEDPVREIPVARALVAPFADRRAPAPDAAGATSWTPIGPRNRTPGVYERRATAPRRVGPRSLGGDEPVLVDVPLATPLADGDGVRRELDRQTGVRVAEEARAEIVTVHAASPDDLDAVTRLRAAMELVSPRVALSVRVDPAWITDDTALEGWLAAAHRLHVRATSADRDALTRVVARAAARSRAVLLEADDEVGDLDAAVGLAVAVARAAGDAATALTVGLTPRPGPSPLRTIRLLAGALDADGLDVPIALVDRPLERGVDPETGPAASLGALLCDGVGDTIQVDLGDGDAARRAAFGILQAARVRITRTEFISCPSCGRTLFDLEETTARIKARTAHLKGVKIAVMGCIVNGPGEMADADFGYVGWGEDKIALFVGKDMVAKDIPTAEADERLVRLIREHGRWVDPPKVEAG